MPETIDAGLASVPAARASHASPVASTSKLPSSSTAAHGTPSVTATTSQLPVPSSAASSTSVPSARLLWRGRLKLPDAAYSLPGLAVVSTSFDLSRSERSRFKGSTLNASSPATTSNGPFPLSSPVDMRTGLDDKGEGDTPRTAAMRRDVADACLGFEMLRNADMTLFDRAQPFRLITAARQQHPASSKGKKKEPAQDQHRDQATTVATVEVCDHALDGINLYVDPRCPETVDWFEHAFCTSRNAQDPMLGYKVDVGGETLVLFARYPKLVQQPEGREGATRPAISLCFTKLAPRPRVPRPDDPMPRETVYGRNKLFGSKSDVFIDGREDVNNGRGHHPALARKEKKRTNGGLSRTLTVPSFSFDQCRPSPAPSSSASALARDLFSPQPVDMTNRLSSSSSMMSKKGGSRTGSLKRSTSAPVGSALFSGDAGTSVGGFGDDGTARRAMKKARTTSLMRDGGDASMTIEEEDEEEGGDEAQSQKARRSGGEQDERAVARRGRSVSAVPAPRTSAGLKREASVAVNAFDDRNKGTTRKIVAAALAEHGVTKEDDEFKDVFMAVYKGAQFAFRREMSERVVEKDRIRDVVQQHCRMYVVSTTPPSSTLAPVQALADDRAGEAIK